MEAGQRRDLMADVERGMDELEPALQRERAEAVHAVHRQHAARFTEAADQAGVAMARVDAAIAELHAATVVVAPLLDTMREAMTRAVMQASDDPGVAALNAMLCFNTSGLRPLGELVELRLATLGVVPVGDGWMRHVSTLAASLGVTRKQIGSPHRRLPAQGRRDAGCRRRPALGAGGGMSDPAASLIAPAPAATPAVSAAETAARLAYGNSDLYAPRQAAPPPAPAAKPTPPAPKREQHPGAQVVQDMEAAAHTIYGIPAVTKGAVDWTEPGATAAEFQLDAPAGVVDQSPDGRAAMVRLWAGLEAAGAGPSLARELFGDAVAAQRTSYARVSPAAAEAQLRGQLGGRYDAAVAAARGLVQQVAKHSPEIIANLEQTGLGNDPAFILKLAKAAMERRR